MELAAVGKLLVLSSRRQGKVVAKMTLDDGIVRRIYNMVHVLDER